MFDGRVVFIILLILTTLFFIAFVVTIFVYNNQLSSLIEPSQCPAVNAGYTVQPDVSGAIAICGVNNCTFNASTLAEAIALCDANLATCTQFTWDQITGVVNFISNPVSPTAGVNLYVKP